MNLREELMDYLGEVIEEGHGGERVVANEILKLIEKRIDSIEEYFDTAPYDEEVDYGITITLDKIKEMLK